MRQLSTWIGQKIKSWNIRKKAKSMHFGGSRHQVALHKYFDRSLYYISMRNPDVKRSFFVLLALTCVMMQLRWRILNMYLTIFTRWTHMSTQYLIWLNRWIETIAEVTNILIGNFNDLHNILKFKMFFFSFKYFSYR